MLGLFALASDLRAEVIRSFDSEIRIADYGTLEITERIVMDFEATPRRGIFRIIPYRYERYNNPYRASINILEVTDENGNDRPYKVDRTGGTVSVRIGDPDVYVTGRHTYVIRYTARRAMNFFSGEPEVYWNATGDEWPFAIEQATARLILPEGVDAGAIPADAFSGPPGSTQQAETNVDGNALVYSASRLMPGSGLTILARLPAGSVERPTFLTRLGWWLRDWWPVLLLPLLSLGLMSGVWRARGRDEGGGQAIPVEWDPPEGLSPAEVGTLVDEVCHTHDVVATIVDLAARGHLRIRRLESDDYLGFTKADYQFIRTQPQKPGPKLLPHERDMLDALFKESDDPKLSDLRGKFHENITSITSDVYQSLTGRGFFKGNPASVRGGYIAIGVLLLIAGLVLTFFLGGFGFISLGIGLAIAAVPVLIFARFMPARTLKGSTALRECRGFRRFLVMVEKDRLAEAYRQDPAIFGRLLPYAMVLGVEDKWATQFEGLMDRPPDWYDDGHGGTFVPSFFISSLGDSVSSMGTNLSAVPASSGAGGGTSGFSSGGGFSGGGFGGGGGGSW